MTQPQPGPGWQPPGPPPRWTPPPPPPYPSAQPSPYGPPPMGEWGQTRPPGAPAPHLVPAKPATNVLAIVSVACAAVAALFITVTLIVVPLGVAAIVTGGIGERHARKRGLKLGRLALLGLVVGLVEVAGVLIRIGVL